MAICGLTTEDNPFDPLTDYDNWNAFDQRKGYGTASYLARMANITADMTPEEQERIVEEAVDKIVALNLTGNYKKVTL